MASKIVHVRIETEAELKQLQQFNQVVGVTEEQIHKTAIAQERLRKGTDKMTGESKINGRAILEVSRAWEDLQYGISGVLNNIPSIIQAFKLSAGVAGTVSIALVTLNAAWKLFNRETKEASVNLDKLSDDLGSFADETADSIEESTKKWNAYTQSVKDATRIAEAKREVTEDAISAEEHLLRVQTERDKLAGITSAREADKIEFDSKQREIVNKALANLPQAGRTLDDLRKIQQRTFGELTARRDEAEEALDNARELVRVRDEELKRLEKIAELERLIDFDRNPDPALRRQRIQERRALINSAPGINLEAQDKRIAGATDIAEQRRDALAEVIEAYDQGKVDIEEAMAAEKALAVEVTKRQTALIELQNARTRREEQRDKEEAAVAQKLKDLEDQAVESLRKNLEFQEDQARRAMEMKEDTISKIGELNSEIDSVLNSAAISAIKAFKGNSSAVGLLAGARDNLNTPGNQPADRAALTDLLQRVANSEKVNAETTTSGFSALGETVRRTEQTVKELQAAVAALHKG